MPTIDLQYGGYHDRLYYLDENPGNQRAVLFLHGLGATCESWQLQVPDFSQAGYRLLIPDLPGFGQSTCQGGRWRIERAAEEVSAFIDDLGIASLNVAGISMGGTVALQLALQHPQQVRHLALINTFARLRSRNWSNRYYLVRRFLMMARVGLAGQAGYVAQRIFPEPDQAALREELIRQITHADPRLYRSAMVSLALYNGERRLRSLRLPCLVVTGERDTTVDLRLQACLARGIPGARQVMIRGAGHAVIADHPAEFNRVVLDFLAD